MIRTTRADAGRASDIDIDIGIDEVGSVSGKVGVDGDGAW